MVFVDLDESVPLSAAQAAMRLESLGVKVGVVAPRRFRFVTHYWIDDAGIEQAIYAFAKIL
jgi:hypothetical protein